MIRHAATLALMVACSAAFAGGPRARELGVPFDGTPGPLDAITDVAGVAVGQVTLVEDLPDGHKVRTGVTAVLPRGRESLDAPVFAGWFPLNGNGEMTGTAWIEESGQLEGPVMLTNTHSVGVVRDAVIAWRFAPARPDAPATGGRCPWWPRPGTATSTTSTAFTCARSTLRRRSTAPRRAGRRRQRRRRHRHDLPRIQVRHRHRVARRRRGRREYTLGALVQANYGPREALRIAGVPVGQDITGRCFRRRRPPAGDSGSIIVVLATDAPLLPTN